MLISVVVPCYNEEAVIRETHERLSATLGQLSGFDYELIYVDDGSRDETLRLLHELQETNARASSCCRVTSVIKSPLLPDWNMRRATPL
jgi:glycosyltransferase involved in cell wall biosynthesis